MTSGCHISTEQLSAYYDGEGTPETRRQIAVHLETCLVCAETLASYESISSRVSALFTAIEAPSWLENAVYLSLAEIQGAHEAWRLKWGTLLTAILMAVGLVAIATSPVGRIVWSIIRLLFHGVRGIFRSLRDLPFGAGTGAYPVAFVVICFACSILFVIAGFSISRRWHTV